MGCATLLLLFVMRSLIWRKSRLATGRTASLTLRKAFIHGSSTPRERMLYLGG